jgi:hypothetical protein
VVASSTSVPGFGPDPEFGPAWFDIDEQRDEPIPHRYLHGGFEGTTTRFRIRFPEATSYRGRMIQMLGGGTGGSEHQTETWHPTGVAPDGRWINGYAADDPHRWLVDVARRGAFLVESNEGFRAGVDPAPSDLSLNAYRATAHTAWFAHQLAADHYGRPPEHRYVTGFSGGGCRTINVLERTRGVFAGGVGGGITSMELTMAAWSVVADAAYALRDRLDDLATNADAGGSDDPFAATHTDAERSALAALYGVGYPFGNERALRSGIAWVPAWHYLSAVDPSYLGDFFEASGYAGRDGSAARLRGEATVVESVDDGAGGRLLRLEVGRDPGDLIGAELTVLDGPRAGGRDLVTAITGGLPHVGGAALAGIGTFEPGDRVAYDNGRWLALRHYHRDVHRRPPAHLAASLPYTGDLWGRLLLVQMAHDHLTLTNVAHAYAERVRGAESARVWWIENADHFIPAPGLAAARYVDIEAPLRAGLDTLIAWVEDGAEPPAATSYHLDEHGILRMPATAVQRAGIQPTIGLEADGGRRIEVDRDAVVRFRASAEAPAGAEIVEIAWDVAGVGDWEAEHVGGSEVVFARTHRYSEPGVVLAGVRVRSRHPGSDEVLENLSHALVAVR